MGYRYIGAKTKVLNKVLDRISHLIPLGGSICDLMCGTAAVSGALRKEGYRVTAIDIMTFSYHHARVALLFTKPPAFQGVTELGDTYSATQQRSLYPLSAYERVIATLNHVEPKSGYFWREYSMEGCPNNAMRPRNYFSAENAKRIDAIRSRIVYLHQTGQINDLEHSLLIHDLIMAANDAANIAGTYGHYLAKLIDRAKIPLVLKPSPIAIYDDLGCHSVLKGYAENLASDVECDLCYIDPPYKKRQYAANYHILETLAREDEPEAIGISGLRPWRDQYSNFCTRTKIYTSFSKIFTEMKCSNFLISYSEDGLLSLDELIDFLSKFGKLEVSEFRYKRFKSNETKLSPELTEYLIYLKINN